MGLPGNAMARTDSILDVDKYVPEPGLLSHGASNARNAPADALPHVQIDRLI